MTFRAPEPSRGCHLLPVGCHAMASEDTKPPRCDWGSFPSWIPMVAHRSFLGDMCLWPSLGVHPQARTG